MPRQQTPTVDFMSKIPQELADIIFDHVELRDLEKLCQVSKALKMMVDNSHVWKKWCTEMGFIGERLPNMDYRNRFLTLNTRLRNLDTELTGCDFEQFEQRVSGKKFKLREFSCDDNFFVAAGKKENTIHLRL